MPQSNNRIEFRAWHKEEKRMLAVYSWSNPIITVLDYKYIGEKALRENPKCNLNNVQPYRDLLSENVVLMQFTGFTVNKKKLYQSDLIAWIDYYGKQHNAEVVWSPEFGHWGLAEDGSCSIGTLFRMYVEFKIVGNIYQHPKFT